ncbi:hypothetical protein J437_LFUL016899 [Ladona fulva]|uniref:Spondin domain-containing protein n=1 Tax=Ladona fulva TaxID=123851 RepID=A0A8K0P8J6_LADFU|nr:hypothetical protein J437_LFUL016899 [Ladona fulva]
MARHRRPPLSILLVGILAVVGCGAVLETSAGEESRATCSPQKLTVYKVVLRTFWSRDLFPKHYPDWRPSAQWTKLIEFILNRCLKLKKVECSVGFAAAEERLVAELKIPVDRI